MGIKGSGTLLVRLYRNNGQILGFRKSLHMPMVELFYMHFAMESVPDPYQFLANPKIRSLILYSWAVILSS